MPFIGGIIEHSVRSSVRHTEFNSAISLGYDIASILAESSTCDAKDGMPGLLWELRPERDKLFKVAGQGRGCSRWLRRQSEYGCFKGSCTETLGGCRRNLLP